MKNVIRTGHDRPARATRPWAAAALAALLIVPALARGDAWSLVDHNGEPVTAERVHGSYSLVYFGYTHCPDICPLGLFTLATALKELGDVADSVTPWFVTIDPERDTTERLGPYVAAFHPRLLGVTGEIGEIRKMARDYGARFTVAVLGDDYFVDHSAYLYLQGPDGQVLERFGHDVGAGEIAATLGRHLDQ